MELEHKRARKLIPSKGFISSPSNPTNLSESRSYSHGHNDLPKFILITTICPYPKVPATTTFAKLKAKEPVTAAMSAFEIQSWISSSTNEGEENGDQRVWQRDQVLNDWPRSLEYAQTFLLNGKTKSRILFLQDEILSLAKHGGLYSIHPL